MSMDEDYRRDSADQHAIDELVRAIDRFVAVDPRRVSTQDVQDILRVRASLTTTSEQIEWTWN